MKWLCFLTPLLVLAVQPLFAVLEKEKQELISVESKLKRLEQELGIKTPPPKMAFNLFGEFLYWKASMDGVAYAMTAVQVENPDGSDGYDRIKTRSPHFQYDPGFIIGAGIQLPYDQWDVAVQWLRFHTTGKDKVRGSLDGSSGHRIILDSIGMLEALLTPPSKAKADCQVHLDLVDLVMGRAFFWSKYFEFRPFAGLRGAWLDINWDISFTRPIFTSFPTPQTYAFLNADNHFNAIGFLGGFDSEWTFFKGLGLFSYATASLVYGKSSERTQEKFFFVPGSGTTALKQKLKADNSSHTVKGIFDLALGLKWGISFKKRYELQVRAGYDFFYWPNVTQKTITQNNRVRDRADLSFQGLILELSLNSKILVVIFIFLTLQGSANVSSMTERIRKLEEQKGFYPKDEKAFNGIAGGELLYWKADVDGVAYATTSRLVKANGVSGTVSKHIQTQTPHFGYDPGFRVFLGVQSPYDLFDVILVWTSYSTEGHHSMHEGRVDGVPSAGDKVIFNGIGLIQPLTSVPNHAKTECRIKGNLLDVQLGRGIAMSKTFFFRPYFGVRAVWSKADWCTSFTQHFIVPEPFAQESVKLKVDNHFRAAGTLFGVMAEWRLPKGFGITTRGAGALVYGLNVEATHQNLTFLSASSASAIDRRYKAHNCSHSVKGMWELFGGLYWETPVHKPKKYRAKVKQFHLRFIAGYELQQWPYIAQKTNIQTLRQRERYSLSFEGFTGGVRIVY